MPEGWRPRVVVLVPAHNKHLVIGETLASISRQLETGDRLVVVADNCSDHTADTARRLGSEVTIHSDPTLRGKGCALDHGLRFIQQTGARFCKTRSLPLIAMALDLSVPPLALLALALGAHFALTLVFFLSPV